MGYFCIDPDIIWPPEVVDLSAAEFRALIIAASRYNRTRRPEDAIPDEFAHLFRFPRRARRRRKKVVIDRHELWERFAGICYLCREHVDYGEFHVEHIVPLARGGADSIENVSIAHPACNRRKGTMLLSELDWIAA